MLKLDPLDSAVVASPHQEVGVLLRYFLGVMTFDSKKEGFGFTRGLYGAPDEQFLTPQKLWPEKYCYHGGHKYQVIPLAEEKVALVALRSSSAASAPRSAVTCNKQIPPSSGDDGRESRCALKHRKTYNLVSHFLVS